MEVRFWGVRGSVPVSGGRFVRTGGNTSCVEVVHGRSHLVLDGGTGLRALGDALPAEADVAVLFSHVHVIPVHVAAPQRIGPFTVRAVDLDHPDGITAYRVEAGGRSVVYATDIEHGDALDPRVIDLARGADLLVHDAQYTDAEYRGAQGPSRRGWGHATWEQAAEVADRAGVRHLALFHHDPARDDDGVSRIEADARRVFARSFAAREGHVVHLGG